MPKFRAQAKKIKAGRFNVGRIIQVGMMGAFSATIQIPAGHSQSSLATARGLEEIVVTARREAESVQDVPITIAAVSGGELTARAITNVSEIQYLVPTLRVVESAQHGESTLFALRGMRSAGVVSYFGEVPANGGIVGRELYDIASVQVLKGPQGTLFGKNTSAGAILFEPAIPKNETSGFVQLKTGDYNALGGEAMFNSPLTDTLFLRVAGQWDNRDGFTKIVGRPEGGRVSSPGNLDSSSQRVSLLYSPSEKFENLIIVDRFYADETPRPLRIIGSTPCPDSPSFTQMLIQGSCAYPGWDEAVGSEIALGARKTNVPFRGRLLTDSWGVIDHATFNLNDDITIKNIFGYRKDKSSISFDGDGTPFDMFTTNSDEINRAITNELQLQANFGQLRIILGGFYGEVENELEGLFRVGLGNPLGSPLDPIERVHERKDVSKAIFSQGTYAVTDKLNLTAGYRFTRETRDYDKTDFQGGDCAYVPGQSSTNFSTCKYKNKVTFDEPSWTLSADYQVFQDTMIYATVRRGFNSGGINLAPPEPYGTETIDDVEIGIKNEFYFGGVSGRVNVSAFHSKYDDIQRQITNFVDGNPKSYIQNAAKATVQGVEFESKLSFGRFELSDSFTYIDAKYDDFQTETAPGVFADLKNNAMAQAPKITNTLTGRVFLPILESVASEVTLTATYAYQSETYFSDFNQSNQALSNKIDSVNYQKSYSIVNLMLTATDFFRSGFDASFFVKNLNDTEYSNGRTSALSSFGYATASYGDPKTIGLTLAYRFNN